MQLTTKARVFLIAIAFMAGCDGDTAPTSSTETKMRTLYAMTATDEGVAILSESQWVYQIEVLIKDKVTVTHAPGFGANINFFRADFRDGAQSELGSADLINSFGSNFIAMRGSWGPHVLDFPVAVGTPHFSIVQLTADLTETWTGVHHTLTQEFRTP